MMHYCSTKRLNGKEQHCTEKKKKRKTIKNREDDIIVKKKKPQNIREIYIPSANTSKITESRPNEYLNTEPPHKMLF